jgi:hypothetical protein
MSREELVAGPIRKPSDQSHLQGKSADLGTCLDAADLLRQ